MARLRIIGVEKVNVGGIDSVEPAIACVYKDKKLHVYDTFGELYHQKEYFGDFDSLKYLISKGKYEWTDFYIEKGQLITRDIHDNIVVEGDLIDPFIPFEDGKNSISNISVKIYYEFLKTINREKAEIVSQIQQSYESGSLKKEVDDIIAKTPFNELNNTDKELIVRTKIDGFKFVVDTVKENLKSRDYYKVDEVQYFFSRLFKLEKNNYIEFDTP